MIIAWLKSQFYQNPQQVISPRVKIALVNILILIHRITVDTRKVTLTC